MAQAVDEDAFLLYPGGDFCFSESALDAFDGHGRDRCRSLLSASADCRENESGVPVRDPIPAQQGIG